MKYIKIYEEIKIEPQVGDYVICVDKSDINLQRKKMFVEYLKIHIGKIIKTNKSNEILVQYDPIPTEYEILDYAFYTTLSSIVKGFKYNTINTEGGQYTNIATFGKEEIIHFSPNKEDLEPYINANKYNL